MLRVPGASGDSTDEAISCFGASAPFSVLASSSEIENINITQFLFGEKKNFNALHINSLYTSIKSTLKIPVKVYYSPQKREKNEMTDYEGHKVRE